MQGALQESTSMTWNRSKQTYWILRRGDPWKVISMKNSREVCNFPAYEYSEKIDEICFAENDEQVKRLVEEIEREQPRG